MSTAPPPPQAHAALVCCRCRGGLSAGEGELRCAACGVGFPVEAGVADFAQGVYFDDFEGPEQLSEAALAGLDHEVSGTRARVEDYYGPLLDRLRPGGGLRILDSGCGNGLSVELLRERGHDAWGNDLSRLRRWQWRERRHRNRLVVADTRRLPFADGFFDAVISSGVLEHVGVDEGRDPHYWVARRPDQRAARAAFLAELLRVTAPGGRLFLDFPNGAFPIDFWHGDSPGAARWHDPREGFLPTLREVRETFAKIAPCRVRPLSPCRRLRMRQVGGHWYGRLLRPAMNLFLYLTSLPPLRPLAGSPLNPYLVLEVTRTD